MAKIKRLLEAFEPQHYQLFLNISEGDLRFEGKVTISGKLPEDSDSITLHAKKLTIKTARVGSVELKADEANKHHEITLNAPETINSGKIELEVEFSGDITDDMVGIYPCDFKVDGKAKKLIATQFEANHAREAFPCIDEPAAKATYALTLETESQNEVLSNTPVADQKENDGRTTTTFEKTPRMSAYLLAFATGDIHSTSRKSANGIEIAAWASSAQKGSHLDFAADEAVKILDFFEEYFGVPFPLPKLDLIALPDFDSGAMENWGLITFREIAMMADPDNRSVSNEQYVSMVIAHEISHMWFGDLVTMEWWDDLWLNESFASIMEHVALAAIHPDWNQWEHYAASDILVSTSRDIHKDIQPISIELDDPELIETMFDPGIVYTKGGRLLKMIMEYIGEDHFRAGLKLYFEKHKYQNTVRSDLWDAFGSASNTDINSLMDAWLNQPGMPLLTVNQSGGNLKLNQQRFIVGGETDETIWPIPTLAEPIITPEILDAKEANEKAPDNYVLLNSSASGHYITHYANADHLSAIGTKLKNKTISSDARINVLNDLILLSRNDLVQYDTVLGIVKSMKNEDRYAVWALISKVVGTAQQLTEGDEETKQHINAMRLEMVRDKFTELGLEAKESDTVNDTQLRGILMGAMLGAEDAETLELVRALAAAKTPEDLPSEDRSIMLSALVRGGDTKLIAELTSAYSSATADMQLDIILALSSTRDADVAKQTLLKAIGPDGFVRSQDILRWLAIFLRNHYIRDITWQHMVDNWEWLEATLLKSKSFDFLPTYCAAVITTEAMANKFHKLFDPLKDHKILKRNIQIATADIKARIQWRKANEKEVAEWFKANY